MTPAPQGTSAEARRRRHVARNALVFGPLLLAVAVAVPVVGHARRSAAPVAVAASKPAVATTIQRPSTTTAVVATTIAPDAAAPAPEPPSSAPVPARRTSQLISAPPRRLLDTRAEAPLEQGEHRTIALPSDRPPTAVLVSVSLIDSAAPGSVRLEAGRGSVTALTAAAAGAATTNLIAVPTAPGSPLTVTNDAGGHLVLDVVGEFQPVTSSAAGRFVSTDPVRIAHLVTKVDGREGVLDATRIGDEAARQSSALLVLVTAVIGRKGGTVSMGPEHGQYDQMLHWGPNDGRQLQRRGVALLVPGADGTSFRYDGGSIIDIDVIGYFTNDLAPISSAGLFIPSDQVELVKTAVPAGTSNVGSFADRVAGVFVNASASPGFVGDADPRDVAVASGRTIGLVLDPSADGHTMSIRSSADLDARLELLGVFSPG
jgi:hypothetical protein